MATTFTGLSEAKIDDVIIGSIQASLPLLDAFSTQLDHPEGLVIGNTYKVPLIGALTVGDKTAGTLKTASGSLTGQDVTTSAFKAASFEAIEGNISSKVLAAWWEKQVVEATRSVAQTVVDAALGLVTATNYGSNTGDVVTDADFDDDTVVELRTKAKNKLKNVPGAFICAPSVASQLIKMQNTVLILGMAQGKNLVTDGQIPGQILGYRAFEYVDMPGNSEHLVGAVIGKTALAIVAGAPEQILSSGDGDVRYRRVVTDPESGLSVQYTEVVCGGGKVTAELGVIYGVAKAIDAVVRLVTE